MNSWTIASVVLKVVATLYVAHGLVVLTIQLFGRAIGVSEALISAAFVLAIGVAVWLVARLFDRKASPSINSSRAATPQ